MLESFWAQLVMRSLAVSVISYLLGSISFAVIFTKIFSHKDVRDSGSGNAGMTNVLRTSGKLPAILTLIGDFGKAILAIYISKWIFSGLGSEELSMIGKYIGGLFVLLGHIYPIFFGFRGGKGVLTCAGIFFVLDPVLCLLSIGVFIIVALISGYVSLGSIISMGIAPFTTLIFGLTLRADTLSTQAVLWQTFFIFLIVAISVSKHKENIKRLINGTENGFKKKQKERAKLREENKD